MQFMSGMYWAARSPLTERIRMRDWRVGGVACSMPSFPPGFAGPTLPEAEEVEERRRDRLFMYVRAKVRAPAMEVVMV